MGKITKYLGLNNRFYINYSLLLVLFILFPVIAITVPDLTGFIIIEVLFGLVGVANSIS
jgi:hypothetical protein